MAIALIEETERVVELLGVKGAGRWSLSEPGGVREAVRRGLPYSAFERCRDLLEMRREELAELLGVAPRTLARRKQARRLSPEESDRLYRIARMVGLAETVLGSLDKARQWMQRPNRSMGGVTPLSLLDTGIGARSVEQVLGRLEHGIHG